MLDLTHRFSLLAVFLGAIGYVISYMYLAMKINHVFFFLINVNQET
jgi:hypothetical protein